MRAKKKKGKRGYNSYDMIVYYAGSDKPLIIPLIKI